MRKVSLEEAMEVKKRCSSKLLSIAGVIGVGVGGKEDDAKIVVSVIRLTEDLSRKIPRLIEGVPVEIIETGPIRALRKEK